MSNGYIYVDRDGDLIHVYTSPELDGEDIFKIFMLHDDFAGDRYAWERAALAFAEAEAKRVGADWGTNW